MKIEFTFDPKVRQLVRSFMNMSVQKQHLGRICVEVGHIYANRPVTQEQVVSFSAGAALRKFFLDERERFNEGLKKSGIEITESFDLIPVAFIDNYNAPDDSFDLDAYLAIACECGFAPEPEMVFYEADMQGSALKIIDQLKNKNLVDSDGPGLSLLVKGKPQLIDEYGRLTCAVLDSALYLLKKGLGDFNITFLPAKSKDYNYSDQQKNVSRILAAIGAEIPRSVIFFKEDGLLRGGMTLFY